ncbi:MAG: ABC transporter substrate-binding protein/permease [Planctomycetia bacterium]|nr:ABC transporter substrate-binding protein/permease [Planctomycetia bacterium]
MNPRWLLAVVALLVGAPAFAQEKELRWGTDPTGGAPYVYQDAGGNFIGFEYEFAAYLAKKLGRQSVKVDADWSTLPELLEQPRGGEKGIDIVLNGYEQRNDLAIKYGTTIPYYVYRLQLVGHKDSADIMSWGDLAKPGPGGKRKVGVLEGSVAADYSRKLFGERVEVLESKDVAIMFEEVKRKGRLDATVQDNPACIYFTRTIPELKLIGEGRQPSYYVIYLRKTDVELLNQINDAIKEGLKDGTLQRIYSKYGLWNADQEWLCYNQTGVFPVPLDDIQLTGQSDDKANPWPRLLRELLLAAGMTIFLAVASFPLAMAAGMMIAVGRVYGPTWLAFPLAVFVEVIRGTPLLLQLYFLFFMIPKIDPIFALDPIYTGILGLAINYAAYEAENYRAGLLAIPKGQMEAALALGMSPFTAIRTVIVPQAFRIVIPPVTNDFIALFKDTSVCSVILITELTRKYNELYNFNRDLVVELAFITAGLYLLMSYPMSVLARILEKRMGSVSGGHR